MTSEFHPPVHRSHGTSNAVISLILGLGGFVLSVILIGIFFSVPGLILAVMHLRQFTHDRVLALWGFFVSAVAILLTVLFGVLYFQLYLIAQSDGFVPEWESSLVEWEGVIAPNMEVTTRDGEVIDLESLRGRRVIVHIWDAECPSCDAAVPALNELYENEPEEEIMVIGVRDGDPSELAAYASEADAAFVLATANVMPAPFDEVSAATVTFILDRNGVIQHVLEENDPEQVRQLAMGEDYVGETKAAPEALPSTLAESPAPHRLNQVWTAPAGGSAGLCSGDWDRDGTDEILVVDDNAQLRVFSFSGEEITTVTLDASEAAQVVELGHGPDNEARILTYEIYGYIIDVFDLTGKSLWQFQGDDEINEAHWTDVDGDGVDELLVATDLGLHAMSPQGEALWKMSRLGAVWGQKAVDATGDEGARIIALDENSSAVLLDGGGKRLKFDAPTTRYLTTTAIMRLPEPGGLQLLLGGENLTVAVDADGREVWQTPSDEEDFWRDTNYTHGRIDTDAQHEWVFVEGSGDLVVVTPAGEAMARLSNQHRVTHFTVAEREGDAGILITLRNGVVRAYEMVKE